MRAGSKEMDNRDEKRGGEGKRRKGKKGRNRWSPDSFMIPKMYFVKNALAIINTTHEVFMVEVLGIH